MSEVIDKPDTETKDIVAKAIKNAQKFARQNAEKPDNWLVDWTLYCGSIVLEVVVSKAKKIGESEWESAEEVVFSTGSACMITAQPQWVSRKSPKIDLREKIGQGQCVRKIVIRKWSIRINKNGEAEIQVDMDGEVG